MTADSSPGPGIAHEVQDSADGRRQSAWSAPQPERIPPATVAPAAVALGLTLLAFGALTSPILSVVGALLASGAAASWIKEMHDAAER
jgi:hypothetical protein